MTHTGKLIQVRRLLLAAVAGAALVQGIWAQTAPQQSSREVVVTVGKSVVINTSADIERVAVGYGEVAEARAVGVREVLLDGKAPGETSLIIWERGANKLFFDVSVLPNTSVVRSKLQSIRRQIQAELPGQQITVSMENDTIFLRGTAKDLTSAERAVKIASTSGKVANLLYVEVPPTQAQILLKVKFATVDRNTASELGVNIFSLGATNTLARITTGQFQGPTLDLPGPASQLGATLNDALNVFLFRPDLNLGATIRALETKGVAEILAEPNVLAINGKPAAFLAGGEFPYPILQGGQAGIGTVTVAFREFGVRINFIPLITPRGTIRLTVGPEVSSLDYNNGLTIQGYTIPGLATRRVETEIELQSGQSFGIGGLLDRRLLETVEKIPLLSSIPLLGKLFQSRALAKQNNELLVIVTPEIVKPVDVSAMPGLQMPYALPGAGEKMPGTPGSASSGSAPNRAGERIPVEELLQQLKMESDMKLPQTTNQESGFGAQQPLPMIANPYSATAPGGGAGKTN